MTSRITRSCSRPEVTRTGFLALLAGIPLVLGCPAAWSAGPGGDDFEPGFHGSVAVFLGAQYMTPSQVQVADDNDRIDSLDDTADDESEFSPFAFGEISYTLDNRRTQFYLGKAELPLELGEPILGFGVKQKVGKHTVLGLELVPRIEGIDSETWKDPFLTGRDRDETDVKGEGVALSAERPFGLPFTVRYAFGKQSIDKERSGEALLSQPDSALSEAEAAMLERDAHFQKIGLSSFFPLSGSLFLIPGVHYVAGNADGDAYDFDSVGASVGFLYRLNRYDFGAGLSYDAFRYDERHPLFGRERDDDRFATNLRAGYKKPFGWESTRIDTIVAYRLRSSNIDFYESEEVSIGVSLSYRF